MRGGRREGAGRPPGARNKRTVEVEEVMNAVVQEFSAMVPGVFAGDAVAFLQTVYKDPRVPLHIRLDAAAKAARFERPASTTNGAPAAKEFHTLDITGLTKDDNGC